MVGTPACFPAEGVTLTSAIPSSLARMEMPIPGEPGDNLRGLSMAHGTELRPSGLFPPGRFPFLSVSLTPSNLISVPHTLPTMLSSLPPFLLLDWILLTLKLCLSSPHHCSVLFFSLWPLLLWELWHPFLISLAHCLSFSFPNDGFSQCPLIYLFTISFF